MIQQISFEVRRIGFLIDKKWHKKLENLAKIRPVSNFGISDRERIQVVKAAGLDIRHWYKCPNGHHYGIGDCGGAVMTAKCPECKETIEGGSHQILSTNQDAQTEMFEGTEIARHPYVNPFVALW